MGKIGNIANGGVIQGPLGLRPSAVLTGDIRISNRESGIRIHPKPPEISEVQISNRKHSLLLPSPWRIAILDRAFSARPVLIYGSSIKSPHNILKTCHIRISNRR